MSAEQPLELTSNQIFKFTMHLLTNINMVSACIKFNILMLAYRIRLSHSHRLRTLLLPLTFEYLHPLQKSEIYKWATPRGTITERHKITFLSLYLTSKWNSWDLKSPLQEDTGQNRQKMYLHKTKYINLHLQKYTQVTQNIYNQMTLKLDPLKSVSDTNSFKHILSCNWFQSNGVA